MPWAPHMPPLQGYGVITEAPRYGPIPKAPASSQVERDDFASERNHRNPKFWVARHAPGYLGSEP
jgi:hypothetical protein